jgi:hypothetical protein
MSRREIMRTFVLAATLSVAACSDWGEDGLTRLEQLHPTPDAGAETNGSACQMPDQGDGGVSEPTGDCLGLLNGQWAVRLVQFANISPIGPPAWNLTITDLFLAQLGSDQSSLQLTFCGEENSLTDSNGDPQTLGQNTVPQATVNAIAAVPLVVPLPGNGTLVSSQVVWLWGLQDLANPATDPLPTEADAGTVWDQDMDGNPGVTVDVVSPQGEIYLVKRALFDFELGNVSQDWLTGPLQFTLDQNTLGASISILDTTVPITPRSGCTSVYQFRCIDSAFTCASLAQGYQSLFVNAPN